MRILYSHYLPADDHPATRMVHAAAAELTALGHEVRVHRSQVPHAASAAGPAPAAAPNYKFARKALWFTKELSRNRAAFRRDSAAVADFRPDVVLCRQDAYRMSMPLACRRAGVPLVTHADCPVAYETRHFNQEGRWHPPGLVERIEHWTLRSSRAVIAISRPTAKLVREYGVTVPVWVVPNGVDAGRFAPRSVERRAEVRRALGVDTPLVAGLVGTVRAFHGLPLLRDVIRRTADRPDLTWVLVGDGPERHTLADLEGHPRVMFLGRRPTDEIPDLVAALDVMVVPHRRVVPTFYFCPIKVLEAMASGVACLASDQGDVPELLDRGRAGRLVVTDDPAHWAAALLQLLDQPAARAALGEAARERVHARYTWRATAKSMADALAGAARRPVVAATA